MFGHLSNAKEHFHQHFVLIIARVYSILISGPIEYDTAIAMA